jgi:hypothetical protein
MSMTMFSVDVVFRLQMTPHHIPSLLIPSHHNSRYFATSCRGYLIPLAVPDTALRLEPEQLTDMPSPHCLRYCSPPRAREAHHPVIPSLSQIPLSASSPSSSPTCHPLTVSDTALRLEPEQLTDMSSPHCLRYRSPPRARAAHRPVRDRH